MIWLKCLRRAAELTEAMRVSLAGPSLASGSSSLQCLPLCVNIRWAFGLLTYSHLLIRSGSRLRHTGAAELRLVDSDCSLCGLKSQDNRLVHNSVCLPLQQLFVRTGEGLVGVPEGFQVP